MAILACLIVYACLNRKSYGGRGNTKIDTLMKQNSSEVRPAADTLALTPTDSEAEI